MTNEITRSRACCKHERRLYGPGVFDMKAGIVQMMFALRALREKLGELPRPVKVWLVSDEEEGSASSRATTEALAKQCAAVLVCEPSAPGGALKTARKGVGSFTLLTPTYIATPPRVDGWGRLYFYANANAGSGYLIRSAGRDGVSAGLTCGTTTDFNDDIAYSNGTRTPPTASTSSAICAAVRFFVPLKSRCSMKCETPFSLVSS